MGSMRIWSLAAVAGIFIVVVAHERSSAEGGQSSPSQSKAVPTAAVPAVPTSAAPVSARVTGLPDFSELVAASGAAVVNISVTEKAHKAGLGLGESGPGEPGEGDDPLSQFFHHHQMPGPERAPPSHGIGSGFIVSADGYVLTNAHVVAVASGVPVNLTDRREVAAKVPALDKRSHIARI